MKWLTLRDESRAGRTPALSIEDFPLPDLPIIATKLSAASLQRIDSVVDSRPKKYSAV